MQQLGAPAQTLQEYSMKGRIKINGDKTTFEERTSLKHMKPPFLRNSFHNRGNEKDQSNLEKRDNPSFLKDNFFHQELAYHLIFISIPPVI